MDGLPLDWARPSSILGASHFATCVAPKDAVRGRVKLLAVEIAKVRHFRGRSKSWRFEGGMMHGLRRSVPTITQFGEEAYDGSIGSAK